MNDGDMPDDDLDLQGLPRRIPAARYTSQDWHRLERERLWPRTWQMACTVDCVPQPGDWHEYRIGALSALIVRGEDGTIRAFRNVCRHRGSSLLEGCGQGLAEIRCPYHAWSYDLKGRRAGSSKFDLFPLKVGLWAGFVFVNWDLAAEPLESFLGVVPDELAWIGMERYTCRHPITVPVACNWKLVMDAFNEAYHIHAVHPQLMAAADDVNLPIRLLGRHSFFEQSFAVASPRLKHDDTAMWHAFVENVGHRIGRTLATSGEPPPPLPHIPGGKTLKDVLAGMVRDHLGKIDNAYPDLDDRHILNDFHYYVFPNLVFNVFAGWFGVIRARPGEGPGAMLFDFWSFDLLPADHPESHARPQQIDLPVENASALGLVMKQDIDNLPRLQHGMVQPGFDVMHITPPEIRIGHMHQVLDAFLGTSVAEELSVIA